MGEVYRAKDTRLGREVAIKVLPTHFAEEPERLARFEREARALASLNHPNIAQIHAVDQAEGLYFLALELVPGETLEERLARGPLPLEEALDVCRQIAEGLEAAHEAGVIHRDLKPANVRITPEGKVKLLDFGLAKPARESSGSHSSTDSVLSTEAGRLLGTPTYMAPEQARGKSIDRRVDIWALGCVLYECLTARRAFAGETLTDVLGAVLHTEPDLARLPASTPPRLRELLADCLSKDPRARVRDSGEAARQLERVRLEPLARAPAATGRGREAIAWSLATLGALAALLLLLRRPPPAPAAPDARRGLGAKVVEGVERSESALSFLDAGRLLYVRGEASGNLEFHAVLRTLDGSAPEREFPGGAAYGVSPDGAWLLQGPQLPGTNFDILRRPMDGEGEPVPLAATVANETRAFFSPDGKWIAFQSDTSGRNELYLEPFPGPGPSQQLTATGTVDSGLVAWLPDGRLVYRDVKDPRRLLAFEVKTSGPVPEIGTPVPLFGGLAIADGPLAIQPDGTRLLVAVPCDEARTHAVSLIQNWFGAADD